MASVLTQQIKLSPHTPTPESPTKVSFGEDRLSTHMSAAPAFGGQSMGTDACGTPSVITLGKNQAVNQRKGFPDLPGWWVFLFFSDYA